MADPQIPATRDSSLPFVHRDMLDFESGATFGLRIQSRSSISDRVTIRGATRAGTFVLQHTTDLNGGLQEETFNLPDLPIWVSVVDNATAYLRGELYVNVDLIVNGDPVHSLLAGYTYSGLSLSWPPINSTPPEPTQGALVTVTSANPAAGVELSHTVPAGQYWKVRAIRFTLVAAAAAASRFVHLQFKDASGNIIYDCVSNTAQIISETKTYACFPNNAGGNPTDGGIIYLPIPSEIILTDDFTINTLTTALNAGDNFGTMVIHIERYFMR